MMNPAVARRQRTRSLLFSRILVASSTAVSIVFIGLLVDALVTLRDLQRPTCASSVQRHSKPTHRGVFSELSSAEVEDSLAILRDKLRLPHLNGRTKSTTLSDNYVDVLKAIVASKSVVLKRLANADEALPRRVHATVVFGASNVTEYELNLVNRSLRATRLLPFTQRRFDAPEYARMDEFLRTTKLEQVLERAFGLRLCSSANKCAKFVAVQPSMTNDDGKATRRTWLRFYRNVPNFLLHPLPIELLVEHEVAELSAWKEKKVYLGADSFDSLEQVKVQASFTPQSAASTHKVSFGESKMPQPEVATVAQQFSIDDHHVIYEDWQFVFEQRTLQGLAVYDVRYRNVSVAYELSLQDSVTLHGAAGESSASRSASFVDDASDSVSYQLVRGLDCPHYAQYFGSEHFMFGTHRKVRSSVCLFVLDEAIPLRRHAEPPMDSTYLCKSDQRLVAGLPQKTLIVRSALTVRGSDMIMEYRFYTNGVVETRVALTNVLESVSVLHQAANPSVASPHRHMLHFKADLDVQSRSNVYGRLNFSPTKVDDDTKRLWDLTGQFQVHPQEKIAYERIKFESNSKASFSMDVPRAHLFSNPSGQNTIRLHIDINSVSKLGKSLQGTALNYSSWMQYQLVVTQHNDSEEFSSSKLYATSLNQPNAFDFQKYYADNQSIENEDLVAWITIGTQHVPRSEDFPNVQSLMETVKFLLIPFNSFDRDPTMDNPDSMYYCIEE